MVRNGLAQLLQKSSGLVEQLLLVPFFLHSWGAAYYGEWLTLMIIPTVLQLSELGFATTVANTFTVRYAGGDLTGAATIFKVGRLVVRISIVIFLMLGTIVVIGIDWFGWLDTPHIDSSSAMAAVLIALIGSSGGFYSQLYDGWYRSSRKAALSVNICTAFSFLRIVCLAIVLLAGARVVGVSLVASAIGLINLLVIVGVGRRLLPDVCSTDGLPPTWSDIRFLLRKGVAFLFMGAAWQIVLFQGTTLIVRFLLGPEAVATFNTARSLTRSANKLVAIVSLSIFPDFQYEFAAGRGQVARRMFLFGLSVISMLALSAVIVLAFLGLPFYSFWTQGKLDLPAAVWWVMLGSGLLNSQWWLAAMAFRAANQPEKVAIVATLGSLAGVVASYLLGLGYGLVGVALGTLLFELLMTLCVLPWACGLLGQSLRRLPIDLLAASGEAIAGGTKLVARWL